MVHTRRFRGFTLVELLVVIAIIAVLIAILLPALGRAKKTAKTARCLANTRGLGQSLMIYISDQQTNILYPVGAFADNAWTTVLRDYGNTNKLRACPEAITEPLTTGGSILPGDVNRPWFIPSADPKTIAAGAYGINGWILAGSTGTMLGFANSGVTPTATGSYFWKWTFPGASPSTIPIFGDAIWPDGWPREGNVAPTNLSTGTAGNPGDNANDHIDRWCIARHNNAINLSFADSHADTVLLKDLWSLRWTAQWVNKTPPKLPSK